MREWVADYRVLSAAGTGDGSRTVVAQAPARLDPTQPSVVLHLLDGRPAAYLAAASHLRAVAGAGAANVVTLLELGRQADGEEVVAYLAAQHCDGGSLAGGDGPAGEVLRALAGAARGAHQLHEAGVAHGDIRPATVLRAGPKAVLGAPLAALRAEPGQTASADPASRLDTIDPAVLRGQAPSRASDLWSLGATAHHALTGRRIHPRLDGDDALTGVQRVLFEPPVLDPDLEPEVEAVIARCLQPDPADRQPSAGELAAAFDSLAGAAR